MPEKQAVEVKPKSIKGAGLAKDYKEAIKQFIWNGIEAGATIVDIRYKALAEGLPSLSELEIVDNGVGIDRENLNNTFGAFLDSEKESRFTKGGKGKGRFSYLAISSKAVWHTVYESAKDNKNYFYTISVEEGFSNEYEPTKKQLISDETGTTVEFLRLKGKVNADQLNSEDFEQFLALEFGWYLEIYGKNNIEIKRNGEAIEYRKYIADTDSKKINIVGEDSDEHKFEVNYIRWTENIGTESRFYFLNNKHYPVERKPTGFNKVGGRAYGFVHSVYIRSKYFDNFVFTASGSDLDQRLDLDSSLVPLDQKDLVYKDLMKQLKSFVGMKRDEFFKTESETIIQKFEDNKTLPNFDDDPISQSQKADFYEVVKGVYKTAPELFLNLKTHHEKSLLGLLNLTLKTEEREHVIDIVGEVVELSTEERKELAGLLKNAKMSGVMKLLRTLESRYTVCELLKSLVYKHTKTATERNQLQDAIENNCWLFGEEYNLIGADESFNKLKKKYLEFIEKESSDESDASERRPDVFIARQNKISSGITGNGTKVQNLIIELKRPDIKIGTKEYRQIEDYRNIIRKTPEFMSSVRDWHILIIGIELKEEILTKRSEFKHENRPFLVNKEGNFYIYAMTWAEVFDSFDTRHDYLLNDLDYDKSTLLKHIENEEIDIDAGKTTANILEKSLKASGK